MQEVKKRMKTSHDTQTRFSNTEEDDDFFCGRKWCSRMPKTCSNRLIGKFIYDKPIQRGSLQRALPISPSISLWENCQRGSK